MEAKRSGGAPPTKVSPWLIILFTAPVPLLLFVLFFYKWYNQKTDFTKVTGEFVQRQNQVMAYDTLSLARDVSHLLEAAANDTETLALVPPTETGFAGFHGAHSAMVTEYDDKQKIPAQVRIPLYNTLTLLKPNGDEVFRFEEGKVVKPLRKLADCKEIELCDRETRTLAVQMKPGDLRYGNLMRWYVPEGSPLPNERETLTLVYRSKTSLVELGLDYRHLKAVMYAPTFPYTPRADLLHAYENGNYVYVIDSRLDFIAHPRYWHVTGIDRNTGGKVEPIRSDADTGTHRLNVSEYQGEKLKEYFKRLLNRSFQHKSVDMFRAPNMLGTNRVISVSPILLSRGQFKTSGVFGHVSVGCNVDYFEEPKERFVPYY
jgi:hypothetical protein